MSDTPKYANVELSPQEMERLAELRRLREIEAARLRAIAEEQERQRRVRALQAELIRHLDTVPEEVRNRKHILFGADIPVIEEGIGELLSKIKSAATERELYVMEGEIENLRAKISESVRKRYEYEKSHFDSIHQQRFYLGDCQTRFKKLAAAGLITAKDRKLALQAFTSTDQALRRSNLALARESMIPVQRLVQRLETHTRDQQTELREKEVRARLTLGKMADRIAGLDADPAAVRWRKSAIDDLKTQMLRTHDAIESGWFERSTKIWQEVRLEAERIERESRDLQAISDERDRKAQCIMRGLQRIFDQVSQPQEELPGQATTRLVVHATKGAKSLSASIPFYDTEALLYYPEGYDMAHTEIGGSIYAVCDEAESVIEEVHANLAADNEIFSGELRWKGKRAGRVKKPKRSDLEATTPAPQQKEVRRSSK